MLTLNFTPFPVLETFRLLLRNITEDDANEMFALRSDTLATQFLENKRFTDIEESINLISKIKDGITNNTMISWILQTKDTGEMAGVISFHKIDFENHYGEIGIMLFPKFWGSGLIDEAMEKTIHFGFNTLQFNRIEAWANPNNVKSIKVLERFGFEKEAHLKKRYLFYNEYRDEVVYALFKD